MTHRLKYYIIFGSIVLFTTSISAEIIHKLRLVEPGNQITFSIFYIGVVIENMFFSLGLGRKQKLILEEKNISQQKLIEELRKNEQLRLTINRKLDHQLSSLNKQVEIDRLDRINANFEKELAELKVAMLRSQMNPHFIFNSLNSIKLYIIDNDKENAVYYLNKFSKLIRKVLTITREKQISLAEEVETIELYLNIENIRFENEIAFNIEIDPSLNIDTIIIPCLLLQPFIENAIWHGLSLKKDKKKLSIIISFMDPNFVRICIEDNGIGRKKSAELVATKFHKKDSVGIKLTDERLKIFFRDYRYKHSLNFNDLMDGNDNPIGTNVELIIPLK